MRRRTGPAAPDPSLLPPELARGPLTAVWASDRPADPAAAALAAWSAAGTAWSLRRGLGPLGWRTALAPDVAVVLTSLGRAAVRSVGFPLPPHLAARLLERT